MSLATVSSVTSVTTKNEVFQDLPVLTRNVRLNVMELEHSDKQIVNELVYRWCRILTRRKAPQSRILIIDMVGSINPIRLATILKRDDDRMRLVNVVRQCKINATYVTISAHINRETQLNALKLLVIYIDEFFIVKTLDLIKKILNNAKCQVLLVVPKLDRQARDILDLIATNQIIKCDFVVDRRDIGPAPPGMVNESYARYLNQIYIQRLIVNHKLPDRVEGELREDGLHLAVNSQTTPKLSIQRQDQKVFVKRIKTEN